MPHVHLVTSADLPGGEPGGDLLTAELARRGFSSAWVVWDDPTVDWSAAPLTAVRSTWDYHARLGDFLAWAEHVERWSHLANGADAFRWNTDKAYLLDLAATGVEVVPTVLVDDLSALSDAAASFAGSRVLLKPRVGAGGRGVLVVEPDPQPADVLGLGVELTSPIPVPGEGPWVLQPVVESIRTEGETSVFVLDGLPVAAVVKHPAQGSAELRVHEQYGGTTSPTGLTAELATLAVDVVAAAEDVLRLERPGAELAYARVDLLRLDGTWVVSEVEVTEPGLYLDVLPRNARAFAGMVEELLSRLPAPDDEASAP